MATQNQYSVTMSCAGVNTGIWDKMEGGELDSEESKYRPGNMGAQQSDGGPAMVGNITLTRKFDRQRDGEQRRFLYTQVGKGRCTVTRQPLDADGNVNGRPDVYTGILKTVTPGGVDSNGSDPDTYDVVISSEGTIN